MALGTLGTTLTTSLTSINGWTASTAVADVAGIAVLILDDQNPAHPVWPGAFEQNGLLYVPRRGVLKVLPGDYIGVDATGWPILVSANAISSGSTEWTHS